MVMATDLPINHPRPNAKSGCRKITVSIPNELWDEAKSVTPQVMSMSHVVQIALATLVESRNSRNG